MVPMRIEVVSKIGHCPIGGFFALIDVMCKCGGCPKPKDSFDSRLDGVYFDTAAKARESIEGAIGLIKAAGEANAALAGVPFEMSERTEPCWTVH